MGRIPHLLRLRRRRLGEASGIIGTTAEVARLGAGGNHFGWWSVGVEVEVLKSCSIMGVPRQKCACEGVREREDAKGLLD